METRPYQGFSSFPMGAAKFNPYRVIASGFPRG